MTIVTLSEGEIAHLDVGLKGTMNALFLKDLADKTRRGQRGRVEQGKAGGGRCYGYEVVRTIGADGRPSTGERKINEAEAAVVRRIFRDHATGLSPKAIAHALNREGVLGSFGNAWGPSTIHGSAKRANGILNNELYVGRLLWNRQRFLKDPDTGRRIARPNARAEWLLPTFPSCGSSTTTSGSGSRRASERSTRRVMTPAPRTRASGTAVGRGSCSRVWPGAACAAPPTR